MIAELKTAIVNGPQRRGFEADLTDADRVKIRVDRHALLLRGAPTAILASAFLALVTLIVGWNDINRAALSCWAGVICILAAVRLVAWVHFSRRKSSAHALEAFVRFHVVAMAVNGALWGGLAPIFAVHGMMAHAYLPFVIAGMSAATISSAGASWRSVLAFNTPALVPVAATYAVTAGSTGFAIATVVLVYLSATAFLAIRTQDMIVRSIRLRSRNANLLKALSRHVDAAHEAEKRYRALVEASKDVTLIFSPEGRVIYASPSVEAALGAPASNFIGMSTKQLVHPDDFPIFKAVGERSLSNLGEVIPLGHVCMKSAVGDYVALGGRLTNMLYVPGVEGFVFNGGPLREPPVAHLHAAE